jgi:hypothetical protein
MTKLLTSLGLALAMAMTLSGCELYFGEETGGGGSGGGGGGGGWTCAEDADCAAGCFCQKDSNATQGYCEEAGFCSNDADCPDGYTCDARSSCVPDAPPTCASDDDCAAGSYCNGGVCEPSCVCENDAEAQAAGWGYCDELRSTCKPPLAQSCNAPITCTTAAPSCPVGTVPVISLEGDDAGCYTGACNPIGTCDVTPTCEALQHESDCLSAAPCDVTYTGINCQGPGGSQCQAGQPGCICEEYRFAECVTGP